MPKSALIPVMVLWLGFGDASKVVLIFIGCLLPVTLSRVQRRARHRAGADLVGAQPGRQPLAHLVGGGAAERVAGAALRGIRTALALSFVLLVASELIVARQGLGYMIGWLGDGGAYDAMFAVVLTVAMLGFRRRPGLSDAGAARAGVARMTELDTPLLASPAAGGLRLAGVGAGLARRAGAIASLLALVVAWEVAARSGMVIGVSAAAVVCGPWPGRRRRRDGRRWRSISG